MQLCPQCQAPAPERPDTCPSCGHPFDDLPRYPEPDAVPTPSAIEIQIAPDYVPAPAYGVSPYNPTNPASWIIAFLLLGVLAMALMVWLLIL